MSAATNAKAPHTLLQPLMDPDRRPHAGRGSAPQFPRRRRLFAAKSRRPAMPRSPLVKCARRAATQRDFLASSGCDAYQGYFFNRPLPLEEFEEFVQRV